MGKLKTIGWAWLMIWGSLSTVQAQQKDTLHLNLETAEGLLLQNNLGLLAERLNMDMAEAEMIQAKVWPNPTLSIDQFNPYVTSYQKQQAEKQSSLFGKQFGQYRQVEIQLEQVIQLAGKRKKQIALATVSKSRAEAYLSHFLWSLKVRFRKMVYDFAYHEAYANLLQAQLQSIKELEKAYKNQFDQDNLNRMELTRLNASAMTLTDEIIDEKNELEKLQAELIVLLALPEETLLSFRDFFEKEEPKKSFEFSLPALQDLALTHRPDLDIQHWETKWAEKKYTYEKAAGSPDLAVNMNYDRGGGIYKDFVGVGVSIDLPFNNPNKGNIQQAKLRIEQQQLQQKQHLLETKVDVREKYEKVLRFLHFFQDLDPDYVGSLDKTMDAYNRYFRMQSINMATYMDFVEAYIENKEALLDNKRALFNALEDLQYATGTEFKP